MPIIFCFFYHATQSILKQLLHHAAFAGCCGKVINTLSAFQLWTLTPPSGLISAFWASFTWRCSCAAPRIFACDGASYTSNPKSLELPSRVPTLPLVSARSLRRSPSPQQFQTSCMQPHSHHPKNLNPQIPKTPVFQTPTTQNSNRTTQSGNLVANVDAIKHPFFTPSGSH